MESLSTKDRSGNPYSDQTTNVTIKLEFAVSPTSPHYYGRRLYLAKVSAMWQKGRHIYLWTIVSVNQHYNKETRCICLVQSGIVIISALQLNCSRNNITTNWRYVTSIYSLQRYAMLSLSNPTYKETEKICRIVQCRGNTKQEWQLWLFH